MTWTSAFGRACGRLLYAIVNRMALARISPNVLTFVGLVINVVAALLFGYATGENQRRMFFYAGLVVFAAGFFDLVDGPVARASNQVTRFGAFFDSVLDRYSDAALFFGLLVFYARGNRFFYVVLTESYGARVVGDRRPLHDHSDPSHVLHLAADGKRGGYDSPGRARRVNILNRVPRLISICQSVLSMLTMSPGWATKCRFP